MAAHDKASRRRVPRSLKALALLCLGLAIAGVVVAVVSLVTAGPGRDVSGLPTVQPGTKPLFRDTFDGPDGVITNHYAMWRNEPSAIRSRDWEVASGSLLRRSGTAWTGEPTSNLPNLDSSNGSGSEIFRAWTTRSDFGNVRVDMRLRNEGYVDGSARWPAKSWDGIKIWLRRQPGRGDVALYTAELNRRQGNVMIQKRCRGSDRYVILAQTPADQPAQIGRWEHVGASVHTGADGAVTILVIRGGEVALSGTDAGTGGCPPIVGPGRVGIRGDNAQFSFDDFTVSALAR